MLIRGRHVGALLKEAGKQLWADNILTIAAAVAYNFFFSLFPLLLFAAPLVSLVGNKQQIFGWILQQFARTVPPSAYVVLAGVVKSAVFAPNAPGLVSVGALLTLYSASNIFGSLMNALNIAYHVKHDRRPWWKQRLIQLGMVVLAGGMLTIAAVVMLAGPNIVGWVADHTHLSGVAKWGWMILQYPLAFGLVVLALWTIYYILPDFPQHRSQILVGAVIAAALWALATVLFRLYVTNLTNGNATYGAIGGVLLLLSWMYYSMVVVLAGGELNAELAKGTAEVAPKPKTDYDRKVAAAQSERAAADRHASRREEEREVAKGAKRDALAEKGGPGERVDRE